MACGKCTKIPDFEVYLVPYRNGGHRPWRFTGGTVMGQDAYFYDVPVGKVAYNLAAQAYNILDGDVLKWEVSDDGGVGWESILLWGIPDGKEGWSEEDSNIGVVVHPGQGEDYRFRLTVEREGCDSFVLERKVVTTSSNGNLAEADGWALTLDDVVHHTVTAYASDRRTPEEMGVDRTPYTECGEVESGYAVEFKDFLDVTEKQCFLEKMRCMGVEGLEVSLG